MHQLVIKEGSVLLMHGVTMNSFKKFTLCDFLCPNRQSPAYADVNVLEGPVQLGIEYTYGSLFAYTECPRRNVPDFGRVFLMLKYTDITQNTYVQI